MGQRRRRHPKVSQPEPASDQALGHLGHMGHRSEDDKLTRTGQLLLLPGLRLRRRAEPRRPRNLIPHDQARRHMPLLPEGHPMLKETAMRDLSDLTDPDLSEDYAYAALCARSWRTRRTPRTGRSPSSPLPWGPLPLQIITDRLAVMP